MKKLSIFIILVALVWGLREGNCNGAVVMSVLFAPTLLDGKVVQRYVRRKR